MEQAGGRLRRAAWLAAVFLLAFLVRSLYALDQAPEMYTKEQTGTRMSQRYFESAMGILAGDGILWPRVRDKERTGLLARPPGYALYMAAVYATVGQSFLAVQLVQNLLTSAACVLLVLATARLASWPAGLAAGLLAALSPPLGYVSALVLPDALSAVPLLARARRPGARPSRGAREACGRAPSRARSSARASGCARTWCCCRPSSPS